MAVHEDLQGWAIGIQRTHRNLIREFRIEASREGLIRRCAGQVNINRVEVAFSS